MMLMRARNTRVRAIFGMHYATSFVLLTDYFYFVDMLQKYVYKDN